MATPPSMRERKIPKMLLALAPPANAAWVSSTVTVAIARSPSRPGYRGPVPTRDAVAGSGRVVAIGAIIDWGCSGGTGAADERITEWTNSPRTARTAP